MANPLVPLTSGAYQAQDVIANVQRCVNLYPEANPKNTTPPVPVTHYPRPGKVRVGTLAPPPPPTGHFIVVGSPTEGGPALIALSRDLVHWTNPSVGFGALGGIYSAAEGNNVLVVGGRDAVGNAIIQRSTDSGVTWNNGSQGFGNGANILTLSFGSNVFLAGGFGSVLLQSSVDNGANWVTEATGFSGGAAEIDSSFFDGTKHFIGGEFGDFSGGIQFSSTGHAPFTTASNRGGFASATGSHVFGFAYNGTNNYVAVGTTGNNAEIDTSPDGDIWTSQTNDFGGAGSVANSVAFGNGVFVAVGQDASGNGHVTTSADGVTWTAGTTPTTGGAIIESVTFSTATGLFVLTGVNGDNNPITAKSADGLTWTVISGVFPAGAGVGRTVLAY